MVAAGEERATWRAVLIEARVAQLINMTIYTDSDGRAPTCGPYGFCVPFDLDSDETSTLREKSTGRWNKRVREGVITPPRPHD